MQVLLNKYLSADLTGQFPDQLPAASIAHAKRPDDGLKSSIGAALEKATDSAAQPCCQAFCLWV